MFGGFGGCIRSGTWTGGFYGGFCGCTGSGMCAGGARVGGSCRLRGAGSGIWSGGTSASGPS